MIVIHRQFRRTISNPSPIWIAALWLTTSLAWSQTSPAAPAPAPNIETIPDLPETVVRPDAEPATPPPAEPELPGNQPQAAESMPTQGLFSGAIGQLPSASSGTFSQADLQTRPFVRAADILEVVPNLITSDHAGGGKGTVFFLRGFAMDHGTDFSAFVDGVPINLPTHGHGQGYLDINWVIPELIQTVDFRKGPYYVEVGDFSSAGSVSMHLARRLEDGIAKVEGGMYNLYRAVVANSSEMNGGDLLYAVETRFYDGVWQTPETLQKYSAIMKWTRGDDDSFISLSGQAYDNKWTNTNQIPERYTAAGNSRFDNLSPTDGGSTNRYALNAQLRHEHDNGSVTRVDAWSYYYNLDLYGNYTFFLADPVNGDQIDQRDYRVVSGTRLEHDWEWEIGGAAPIKHTAGLWFRNDYIDYVSLDNTSNRAVVQPVRGDRVIETAYALYYKNEAVWTEKFRTIQGFRYDLFQFDVHSFYQPLNSGNYWQGLPQPKFTAIFGPWSDTEFFFNYGMGFHSNDARGVTATVAPLLDMSSGALIFLDNSPGLIQTEGGEIGLRSEIIEGLNTVCSLWYLKIDSELFFTGDTGNVAPSLASRRYGVEWDSYYAVNEWLFLDGEVAYSNTRFAQFNPDGNYVPLSLTSMATAGTTVKFTENAFATLRYRHIGPRPLTADNVYRSSSTDSFNLRLGYQGKKIAYGIDFLNLFNSKDPEVSFAYETRLQGEPPEGYLGRITRPLNPFEWRLYFSYAF